MNSARPMPPALLIRPLRSTDIVTMIEVFRASVRLTARRDYSEEQVRAWAPDEIDADTWAKRYDTRLAWVAEIETHVVGFIELKARGHLDMLYVHPAHQRQGVATALLAQLEAAAREEGAETLFTEASITARPFFERRGFILIAPQTVTVRGERFVNFRMEKRLGALGTSAASP
jgi:putative acetyltransferase